MSLGVEDFNAWMQAASGKGRWRMSRIRTAHRAMNNDWFRAQGLVSLIGRYEVLQVERNRRGTEQVCPVV